MSPRTRKRMRTSGMSSSSNLGSIDKDTLENCVRYIKQFRSGRMIEEMYAPNKKNQQK